jgi:hypothetical protein
MGRRLNYTMLRISFIRINEILPQILTKFSRNLQAGLHTAGGRWWQSETALSYP